MSKKKKIIIGVVAVILILCGGIGYYANTKYAKVKHTDLNEKKLTVNKEMEEKNTTYTNIAFFGIDVHSDDAKDVESDAVVIASLNTDTKEVRLLSIYGNAYLTSADGKKIAVKDIYKNGAEDAVEILNRNLDLDISHFATVNFKALIEVIDAVGGIEVDVKEDEVPHITGYTADLIKVTGKDSMGITQAGPQLLNGTQATAYCRIRATEGGDTVRAERQKLVLSKTVEKLKTMSLTDLDQLIDKVFPQIETNYKLTEVTDYAKDMTAYQINDMEGFPFTIENKKIEGNEDGIATKDLKNDVTKLHQQFFPDLSYSASDNVKKADEILKK